MTTRTMRFEQLVVYLLRQMTGNTQPLDFKRMVVADIVVPLDGSLPITHRRRYSAATLTVERTN